MSGLKKEEFQHPLTDMWMPLITKFSRLHDIPILDLQQESLILEWNIRNKKFQSEKHKQNYFRQALYHQLRRRVSGCGMFEPYSELEKARLKVRDTALSKKEYIRKNHNKGQGSDQDYKDYIYELVKETTVHFESVDDNDIVTSLIQMRPFDEIYYEELVTHITVLLFEKNALAARIFRARIKFLEKPVGWKAIRTSYRFRAVSKYRFMQAVDLIKKVVSHEVCYA